MQVKIGCAKAILLVLTVAATARVGAQGPPATTGDQRRNSGRRGGLVPGEERPAGDPAQITRGKTLYGVSCTACHGSDLRGGDLGGPNLLRSQLALSDREGELIVPVIQGARQNAGMPAIPMSPEDAKAVAAYVRSVIATIGRQGMPPSVGRPAPSILVGNASEGRSFFNAKCGGC